MLNIILEDSYYDVTDLAEQSLDVLKSDIHRLNGIYLSYMKLYKENKDNPDKMVEIYDKLSKITIDIPDWFSEK